MTASTLLQRSGLLADNRPRLLRFGCFDDVQRRRLAYPVLNIRKAWRAGQTDRIDHFGVQCVSVLRAQVAHRLDAQAADDGQEVVHARNFKERALVHELEKTIGADARFLGQALAIDSKRRAVQQLVRMPDAAGAKPRHVVVGDAAQVLERPVHD